MNNELSERTEADAAKVRQCWHALGYESHSFPDDLKNWRYWPLTDDAQCFALVKRFDLWIARFTDGEWGVHRNGWRIVSRSTDLNAAIVDCVALMPGSPR